MGKKMKLSMRYRKLSRIFLKLYKKFKLIACDECTRALFIMYTYIHWNRNYIQMLNNIMFSITGVSICVIIYSLFVFFIRLAYELIALNNNRIFYKYYIYYYILLLIEIIGCVSNNFFVFSIILKHRFFD